MQNGYFAYYYKPGMKSLREYPLTFATYELAKVHMDTTGYEYVILNGRWPGKTK